MKRIVIVLALLSILSVGCFCGGAGVPRNADKPGEPTTKQEKKARARAQAEAEAEAKNVANRKAYEHEVELAKLVHAKALEKYKQDKEAYDTALPLYQAAKDEVDAMKKLNLARLFLKDVKDLEVGKRRLREIIKLHPNAQAAKDATVLLNDGSVPARKVGPDPKAPVVPVAPRLVLPSPPQPVAVVYPPDEDEIAAAEAARKKQEADRPATARVSRENYNKLYDGIYITLAEKILGPAREDSRSGSLQLVSWSENSVVITATFDGGYLRSKAIIGD